MNTAYLILIFPNQSIDINGLSDNVPHFNFQDNALIKIIALLNKSEASMTMDMRHDNVSKEV